MVGKLLAGRTRRLCDVKNCSVLSMSESRETISHSRQGWPATVQSLSSLWRGSHATMLPPCDNHLAAATIYLLGFPTNPQL